MLNLSRWKVTLVILSVIFGVLFSLPNVLTAKQREALPGWLPKKTLNLGLDLQGGSYLLLEVDTAALRRERMINLVDETAKALTDANIKRSNLGQVNGAVMVRIDDPLQVDQAVTVLGRLANATATGIPDLTVSREGDQRLRLTFAEQALREQESKAVEQSIEIIRRRIDDLGTREPSITRQGSNRIVVQAPGESDPEKLKQLIGQTAKLTFHMVDETVTPADIREGRIPVDDMVVPGADGSGGAYVLKRRSVVTGEMLNSAWQENDPQTREAQVGFRFNSLGARRFGRATSDNIGKPFAIVLDDKVISAPVIRSAITTGNGVITGNFSIETANDLAILLNAGALPAPLTVEEQRTVGAELGADAVSAGATSTIVGFVTILVFMLLAYGLLFGGISVAALMVNGLLIIAIMSLTQATLTLPGIAGLILTLAVAVDANVLIYERMRDEIRAGRSVIASMEAGFSRAMTTIIDANVTTILAAVIMLAVAGAGPVKGFAWTLFIGVLTSMFTAVFITQVLLALWFRARRPKSLPIV